MTFLLLVTYCKVGRGQLIGMIRVRIDNDDDDKAFKLPSKYKVSAGNQATRNFLSLSFVFIAMKVTGASLIVAVRIPGP